MVELVVGAQGQKSSNSDSVAEEDLGAAINPALGGLQSLPVRSEKELEAIKGTRQGQSLDTKDAQYDIGEHGREPDDLK